MTSGTSCATARTPSKSPGEAIGKPASITSTPRRASCWPISTFSRVLRVMPGACSPSRRVVSKIRTRLSGSGGAASCSSCAVTGGSSSRMGFEALRARRIRAWVSASSPYRGRSPRSPRRSRDGSRVCAASMSMRPRIPARTGPGKRTAIDTRPAGARSWRREPDLPRPRPGGRRRRPRGRGALGGDRRPHRDRGLAGGPTGLRAGRGALRRRDADRAGAPDRRHRPGRRGRSRRGAGQRSRHHGAPRHPDARRRHRPARAAHRVGAGGARHPDERLQVRRRTGSTARAPAS